MQTVFPSNVISISNNQRPINMKSFSCDHLFRLCNKMRLAKAAIGNLALFRPSRRTLAMVARVGALLSPHTGFPTPNG